MFNRTSLSDLFRHMQWADDEVWRAVLACEPAQRDEVLRGLLLHLHVVQRAFLGVWKQQPPSFPNPADFPSLTDLRAWASPYYGEAQVFLDTVDEAALARPVTMPWAAQLAERLGREPGAPTLAETMFQVTSHSTYHRGQVNARLRAVGGAPPIVDYIAWIWFDRPTPASVA
jgi:uncharacterized damage-inducible protein DinB